LSLKEFPLLLRAIGRRAGGHRSLNPYSRVISVVSEERRHSRSLGDRIVTSELRQRELVHLVVLCLVNIYPEELLELRIDPLRLSISLGLVSGRGS
jgi:hypothetical protein